MTRSMGAAGALLDPVREEARNLDARALGAVPRAEWSDVVVHTGPRSARLAEQQHAAAFTVGRHVVFNQGRYDPASARGRALLAHELTHVQQQRRGGGDLDAGFRMPGSALARHGGGSEADASAVGRGETGSAGGAGGATPVGVARQDKTAEEEDWKTAIKRRARSTVKSVVGTVEAVPTYAAGAVDSVTWIPYAAMDAGDKAIDTAGDYFGVSEEARGYVKNAVPGAVALRAARDYAKSEGLADPHSGVPSLTLAVGRGGDAVEGYVDDAFGMPKEEGFFTDRELALLGTTITIDVALSFVAVEEIVLALKVVGGAGLGKAIYDAVMANPQAFYRSRDFWVAIAQAVLYLVGIGAARLRAKIVTLVSTILSSGVALVSAGMKLAEDYARPDSPERDQALKADVKALLQVVVSAIRQFMTHNRAPAPKTGGTGGGKPAAATPPVDAKPAAPAKPSPPAPTTDPKPNAQKPAAKPASKPAAAPVPVKKKAAPVAPADKKAAPAPKTTLPEKKASLPEKAASALPDKKPVAPEKTTPLPAKKTALPEKSKKGSLPEKSKPVPPGKPKAVLPEKPKEGELPDKPKKGELPDKPKKGPLPEKSKKVALPEKPAAEVPEQVVTAAGDSAPTQKKGPKKGSQTPSKKTAAKEPAKKEPATKTPAKKDSAKTDSTKKDPAKKDPAKTKPEDKAKSKASGDQAPAKKSSPKKSPGKAPAAAKASTPPKKTKKSGAGDKPAGATKTAPAKKKTAKTGPAKPRKSKAQVNAEVAALRKRAKELTKKAVTDKSAAEDIEGLYRAASDEALAQLEPDYLATREVDRRRALNPEADDIRAGRKEFPRMPHEATVVVTNNDGSAAYFAPEGPEGSYGPVSPARRDFRSGGTSTPERRKEVGMNRANQESHTEAKAVQLPLKKGQTMTIMGQYDPCTSCRGFMQRKADVSGAKIVYLWMGGQETFVPTVKK